MGGKSESHYGSAVCATAEIPVLRPMLPTADQVLPYLRRIDNARIYTNFGPLSLELQERLARMFGTGDNSIICASSGTSALIGAILASAGMGRASRPLAMIPGLTFPATAAAAERCGYKPYFVDVDPKSWLLDPKTLARIRASEKSAWSFRLQYSADQCCRNRGCTSCAQREYQSSLTEPRHSGPY